MPTPTTSSHFVLMNAPSDTRRWTIAIRQPNARAVVHAGKDMAPSPRGRAETEPKTLILGAVDKKRDEGLSYADGKTLCVFLNADVGNRRWPANDVARGLPDSLYFKAIWVVERVDIVPFVYQVANLDVSKRDAPVMHVRIAKEFASRTVTWVQ